MRSSKSRSRNKSSRQRTLGNIVNRVFDSSGPEGKVRGTPQQIIDKYLALARDAQLSSDRVAEQSFLQHAEHYTRMLAEAQREMAERQSVRDESDDQPRARDERGEDRQQYRQQDRRDPQDRRDERPHQRRDESAPEGAAEPVHVDAFPPARDVAAEVVDEALSEPVHEAAVSEPAATPAPVEVAEVKPKPRRAPRAAAPRAPRAPRKAEVAEAPDGLASGE